MNKILFTLLFASISFCATQEASAGRKKPKEEEKIAGTTIRRMPKEKPFTLEKAQKCIEKAINEQEINEAKDAKETAMLEALIHHGRGEVNPRPVRRSLFGPSNEAETEAWIKKSPPAPKNEEPFEKK